MPGRRAVELVPTDAERSELLSLAARRSTAQEIALRARIVLACAEGAQDQDVAAELGTCTHTVSKWGQRFAEQRMDGLRDEPRPGAPRTVTDAQIEAFARLNAAITSFIEQHNAAPKPFRWTKSADDILASIERFCIRTAQPAEQLQ